MAKPKRSELQLLERRIAQCRLCVEAPTGKPLPHEPNPIVHLSPTARLCIAGQAAGTLAHASSKPFNDPSGVRLRDWMGITPDEFYDRSRLAIVHEESSFRLVFSSLAVVVVLGDKQYRLKK